jgi:hypothetical protein
MSDSAAPTTATLSVPVDMTSLDNNTIVWEVSDKLHKFKEK